MTLTEGLRAGDLKELVLPFISIDEYKSKLGNDDDVIVVTFFVLDEDPADDLSGFIEKGSNKLLDTEPSPAPNEDGYYLVFVEYIRDEEFPKKLMALVNEIKLLVQIEDTEWTFKPYKNKDTVSLTEKNIKKFVKLSSKTKKVQKESIVNFLKNSFLNNFTFDGTSLVLETFTNVEKFLFVDFGNDYQTIKNNGLMTSLRLDESAMDRKKILTNMLGSDWNINLYGQYISFGFDGQVLLVKEI